MNKYLIFYGIESGARAHNNQSILLTAVNKSDAISKFLHHKGYNNKIQLIKIVDY